jgi:protein-disulfide isomerase-like protein with CxxC motif
VPTEQAASWLILLLNQGLQKIDGAPFAATQLARLTGDRTRDLDTELRARTVAALKSAKAPERWLQMVEEVVTLQADDEARALGDTLPIGLEMTDYLATGTTVE